MGDRNGSFFWVGDGDDQTLSPVKHRRKSKSKKLEFLGWGSRPLIEFLQSIGKDTGKQLSQYDVTAIINEYVHTYNLFNPMKKKRVVCDERLHSLFSKNSVPRNKIYELLNSHFAENKDSSEDDAMYDSDEYEDVNVTYKKQKVSSLEKQAPSQKKKALLSSFAAIIPENIKLLYLKRSLVQELVKHPESFEGKLLGSYIRIKSDPMDFSQKNSHQLHPVTGVKNVPGVSGGHEVLLEVPNVVKDIPIRMLSDDDFSKEEVEDLYQRVKDGLLKRPTVVEVEHKAQTLHEDITKHWLPRELAHLQNLIDRANEKGWRKELFEYLERKKLLQTPSEQSKLLTEVPTVTADTLEPEATPHELVADIEQPNTSPISIHGSDAAENKLVVVDGVDEGNAEPIKNLRSEEQLTSFQWVEAVQMPKKQSFGQTIDFTKTKNSGSGGHLTGFQWLEAVEMHKTQSFGQTVDLSKRNNVGSGEHVTSFQWVEAVQMPKTKSAGQTVDLSKMSNVIDLCDDEEETHDVQVDKEKTTHEQEDEHEFSRQKWFYRDPQGQIQGPFSKTELKSWRDAGYFMPDFKVWKEGQTPEYAILLTAIL
ncbi:putative chromatin remodeling SWIB-Plus-3 family [Helianthus annuus]|nr:putative chromatin remodeling SWIB-Plus-3 family [Helianthus annuus]KAJ0651653.1 putative chromatin remodeling SWIB-Plus-3 family [Helianthus annuus]KAJ0843656.1 putative chromatin remodeling SWIB-Plus-3 family [Helianthus annuus]